MTDEEILVTNLLDLEPSKTLSEPSLSPPPKMTNHEAYERFYGAQGGSNEPSTLYPQPLHHAIAAYPEGTIFGIILAFPCSVMAQKGIHPSLFFHSRNYEIFTTWLNIPVDYYPNLFMRGMDNLLLNSYLLSITSTTWFPYSQPRWPGQAFEPRVITESDLQQILPLTEENH